MKKTKKKGKRIPRTVSNYTCFRSTLFLLNSDRIGSQKKKNKKTKKHWWHLERISFNLVLMEKRIVTSFTVARSRNPSKDSFVFFLFVKNYVFVSLLFLYRIFVNDAKTKNEMCKLWQTSVFLIFTSIYINCFGNKLVPNAKNMTMWRETRK